MSLDLPNVTLICIEDSSIEGVSVANEIMSGVKGNINFYDAKLLSSYDVQGVTHKINPINNLKDYSVFVLNDLIKFVESEFVMIMQKDGYPLHPSTWTDRFLNYDYIGAPWTRLISSKNKFSVITNPAPEYIPTYVGYSVGNGGFSLRSRKLLEEVASRNYKCTPLKWDETPLECKPWEFGEDEYICKFLRSDLESKGFTFAPVELAQAFSAENDIWVGQFGFHGRDTITLNNDVGTFNFKRHAYENYRSVR